jgi:hypothetical protein
MEFTMPQNEWPAYRVGNPDYIHALGVIASVFNRLEIHLRELFRTYTGLPSQISYTLFAKISNQMRLELMHGAIDFSSHPEPIKENVRHFLTGFKICADNRNIFMHSTAVYLFGPDDEPCPAISPHKQPKGVAFPKIA